MDDCQQVIRWHLEGTNLHNHSVTPLVDPRTACYSGMGRLLDNPPRGSTYLVSGPLRTVLEGQRTAASGLSSLSPHVQRVYTSHLAFRHPCPLQSRYYEHKVRPWPEVHLGAARKSRLDVQSPKRSSYSPEAACARRSTKSKGPWERRRENARRNMPIVPVCAKQHEPEPHPLPPHQQLRAQDLDGPTAPTIV